MRQSQGDIPSHNAHCFFWGSSKSFDWLSHTHELPCVEFNCYLLCHQACCPLIAGCLESSQAFSCILWCPGSKATCSCLQWEFCSPSTERAAFPCNVIISRCSAACMLLLRKPADCKTLVFSFLPWSGWEQTLIQEEYGGQYRSWSCLPIHTRNPRSNSCFKRGSQTAVSQAWPSRLRGSWWSPCRIRCAADDLLLTLMAACHSFNG